MGANKAPDVLLKVLKLPSVGIVSLFFVNNASNHKKNVNCHFFVKKNLYIIKYTLKMKVTGFCQKTKMLSYQLISALPKWSVSTFLNYLQSIYLCVYVYLFKYNNCDYKPFIQCVQQAYLVSTIIIVICDI